MMLAILLSLSAGASVGIIIGAFLSSNSIARAAERLEHLRKEADLLWRELHSETCTNVEDCRSFGGSLICHCPPPAALGRSQ